MQIKWDITYNKHLGIKSRKGNRTFTALFIVPLRHLFFYTPIRQAEYDDFP